ncbi:synaptophysin/synaptoporin family protein [Ditylenchus destructor]|uniref:Synaptophysin/synaptoporin family protein n=1 Tax=Ditylenchus destructor TaxID=166010 RepID=A0AAD4N2T1_9BILA|nr:synaptophysin/synaptoporin family protein [Ditylenchus destructor]
MNSHSQKPVTEQVNRTSATDGRIGVELDSRGRNSITVDHSQPITIDVDLSYVWTFSGKLKLLAIVLNLLCLVSVEIMRPKYRTEFVVNISALGFVISLTLMMLCVFRIVDRDYLSLSTVLQLVYSFVWAILHLTSIGILIIAYYKGQKYEITSEVAFVWIFTALMCFLSAIVYALDCRVKTYFVDEV